MNNIHLDTIFETKKFKVVVSMVGVLIVITAVFILGVLVGYHKARFSYLWGDNYDRNFGGHPRGGMMRNIPGGNMMDRGFGFMNAHGTDGTILRVGSTTLMVNGRDGTEKTVLITSSTTIKSHRDTITVGEIKPNDQVVIIGEPNESGQIEARLIRIF